MMRRNNFFLTKWIKHLREGNFEQGQQSLIDGNGRYCCLGVACELDPSVVRVRDGLGFRSLLGDGHAGNGFPPIPTVQGWGLTREESKYLARLNDSGYSFGLIADVIEALRGHSPMETRGDLDDFVEFYDFPTVI